MQKEVLQFIFDEGLDVPGTVELAVTSYTRYSMRHSHAIASKVYMLYE